MDRAPHNGTDTSRAAADAIAPHCSRLELRVLGRIIQSPATCDEIEEATGLAHQTASARLNGLARKGLVADSGERRPTRSGRAAVVWKAVRAEP